MLTLVGAMSGYCSIGNSRIAPAPASMITIEITHAKIGRSMKTREIMLASAVHWLRAARWGALPGQRALGPWELDHLDGLPRLHLVGALDDQSITRDQARVDEPLVTHRAGE